MDWKDLPTGPSPSRINLLRKLKESFNRCKGLFEDISEDLTEALDDLYVLYINTYEEIFCSTVKILLLGQNCSDAVKELMKPDSQPLDYGSSTFQNLLEIFGKIFGLTYQVRVSGQKKYCIKCSNEEAKIPLRTLRPISFEVYPGEAHKLTITYKKDFFGKNFDANEIPDCWASQIFETPVESGEISEQDFASNHVPFLEPGFCNLKTNKKDYKESKDASFDWSLSSNEDKNPEKLAQQGKHKKPKDSYVSLNDQIANTCRRASELYDIEASNEDSSQEDDEKVKQTFSINLSKQLSPVEVSQNSPSKSPSKNKSPLEEAPSLRDRIRVSSPEKREREKEQRERDRQPTNQKELLKMICTVWQMTLEETGCQDKGESKGEEGGKEGEGCEEKEEGCEEGEEGGEEGEDCEEENSEFNEEEEEMAKNLTRKDMFIAGAETKTICRTCNSEESLSNMYFYEKSFFCAKCITMIERRFKSKAHDKCISCQKPSSKVILAKFIPSNPLVKHKSSMICTKPKKIDKYFDYLQKYASMPLKTPDIEKLIGLINDNLVTPVSTFSQFKLCKSCIDNFRHCSVCKFLHHKNELFIASCKHVYCLDCLALLYMKKWTSKEQFTCKAPLCWKKTSLESVEKFLRKQLEKVSSEFQQG